MRHAARFLAAALLGLVLTLPAAAQQGEEEAAALAAEIVELTMADLLVEQMGDSVWPMVERDLRAEGGTADEELIVALREAFDVTLVRLVANASGVVTDFYLREFTRDELAGLRDFYASPLGARVIETGPLLAADVMPMMMTEAQRMLPQALEEIMARAAEEAAPAPAKP